MKDVYGLKPINKTAALVTGQSGCATDDTLTDEQKRENLVAQVKRIDVEINKESKNSKLRRVLGSQKFALTSQINALRPKRKSFGIEGYVLDVLREELSDFEFRRLLTRANDRMRADKADSAPQA